MRLCSYCYNPLSDADVNQLQAENAKLRELVRDIYESAYYEYPSYFESKFAGRMRALGIEVD